MGTENLSKSPQFQQCKMKQIKEWQPVTPFPKFSVIYGSWLYIKAFLKCEGRTKHVENEIHWAFAYISKTLSCTIEIKMSPESFQDDE